MRCAVLAFVVCICVTEARPLANGGISLNKKQGQSSNYCKDHDCQCRSEPFRERADKNLAHRLKTLALTETTSWKVASKPIDWKKIYYISLDQSQNRRDVLLQKLPSWSHGIPYERFKGHDRQSAKLFNVSHFTNKGVAKYIQEYGDRSKYGTIAVYLSHASILEKIYQEDPDGEGLYVVLEDDAVLADPYWKQKVEKLIQTKQLPEDWDMLKMGYWGLTRCEDYVSEDVVEARAPAYTPDGKVAFYAGNVAYIVRPKGIPAILEQLRASELYDVDGATMSLHTEGSKGEAKFWTWGAHTYVTKSPLVFGGLGHESLRLLQTSEKAIFSKKSVAMQLIQRDASNANVKENEDSTPMPSPWLEWPEDHPHTQQKNIVLKEKATKEKATKAEGIKEDWEKAAADMIASIPAPSYPAPYEPMVGTGLPGRRFDPDAPDIKKALSMTPDPEQKAQLDQYKPYLNAMRDQGKRNSEMRKKGDEEYEKWLKEAQEAAQVLQSVTGQ